MESVLTAARCVQALALEQQLIDAPLTLEVGPATPSPLAVRGYLGLLRARCHAGRVPALDQYFPTCFTEAEKVRVNSAIDGGWIDAYRLGITAADRFAAVDCREVAYLDKLASAWRYENDEEMVDGPRLCDVISLFSWFLHLYRELSPDDLANWERADAACVARNRFLDQLDGGEARAAALEAVRAEEKDPDRFRGDG